MSMKLEQQVVSLELAKILKALGVKQESLFTWLWTSERGEYELFGRNHPIANDTAREMFPENYTSAFTTAELGEMLPAGYKTTKGHDVFIVEGMPDEPYSIQRANTEADARAKMLIYLLEQKLIK